ncbi:MAG: DUF2892 domain-containing protein [Patescibacteria group bacterium]
MIKNTGYWDRLARVMVGTVLLTSFYYNQDTYWLLIGIVPLVTGFISYCPLYQIFGFSTCPLEKK